jgi:hypothetical protein
MTELCSRAMLQKEIRQWQLLEMLGFTCRHESLQDHKSLSQFHHG